MGKITALRIGRGRSRRVNVFLDGKFAFSLETELIVKEGLKVGQELTASQIEMLSHSDDFHRCFNAAIRYLGYRPRSESEVGQRLQRHGFKIDCIEAVLARLKETGLIDDLSFARFWKDNRESFSPRSQRLTRLELRRRGVDNIIIDQVLDSTGEDDSAYQAALGKFQHLSGSDYQAFRRRLVEHLRRRGFDYEVINQAVERLWEEQRSSSGELLT